MFIRIVLSLAGILLGSSIVLTIIILFDMKEKNKKMDLLMFIIGCALLVAGVVSMSKTT